MDTAYIEELFGLEGKVAVVTGGGGVLCGALVAPWATSASRSPCWTS